MDLTNSFTVPVPAPEAWRALLDIEQVAQCVPGASLDSMDGEQFTGRVRVKLGPVQLTYQGTARFLEQDESALRAVIEATGKETRGSGTASATVTTTLEPVGEHTVVHVSTHLAVTGRPAQFGRGVLQDVSNRLLDQFAQCLAERLGAGQPEATGGGDAAATANAADAAARPVQGRHAGTGQSGTPATAASGAAPSTARSTGSDSTEQAVAGASNRSGAAAADSTDSLNLVGVAWRPIAKRLAVPLAVVIVAVVAALLFL